MASDSVAPEYVRFVAAQQPADERDSPAMASGEVGRPVFVKPEEAAELLGVAAKRAAGLFRPTRRTELVWVDGDSQLAVGLTGIEVRPGEGLITVVIPVRCDQTGRDQVSVTFVTGSPDRPAGLYAATHRRPQGPEVVVQAWGENLVAFAWQCLLGLITGLAGAVGKDTRGNVLVPAELAVTADGIAIVPMARHRFAGSSGLTSATRPRR